ncbi:hypothetical protein AC062_0564 [Pasteurellaceae bacterium NI1060]|nr:hypothetical protein AC062_0564 [Pasteurellaceae bacterium NI1060]
MTLHTIQTIKQYFNKKLKIKTTLRIIYDTLIWENKIWKVY